MKQEKKKRSNPRKQVKTKNEKLNLDLLKQLCHIPAPCGNEGPLSEFLLNYIKKESKNWRCKPKLVYGEKWQHNLILVFGKPNTAVFAHVDNIGFTVRYGKQLVRIGGPVCKTGFKLVGKDEKGIQQAKLNVNVNTKTGEKTLTYEAKRDFERGTDLSFLPDWRENKDFVQCCYMDNRLGVYTALKLAETLENGVIVFSTYEEHGGGSVSYIQKYLAETFKIQQALICDVSWISDGVKAHKGPVISLRDSLIPRKAYVDKLIKIAKKNKCLFQLEVEGSGGSDAKELQMAEYFWDWCFVGAAEENVHTPDEKVSKKDIEATIELYKVLLRNL